MKSFIGLLLIFFTLLSCASQAQLIPSKKKELWGAITKDNKVKIPFQFKSVDFYTENYFLTIDKNNKKGLYTIEGNIVLKSEFDAIIPLDSIYFQVFQLGKTSIVKKGNQSVIPISFDEIVYDTIQHNFILSKNAKYGVLNSHGDEIIPFNFDNISLYKGKHYLFKKNKQFALTDTLHNVPLLHYFDDLIGLDNTVLVKKNRLWGLENLRAKTLIPALYTQIKPFGKHHFLVKKEKAYGVFDATGKQITDFIYNQPFHVFKDSLFWAKNNDTWVRVNLLNAEKKTLPYEKVLNQSKGYYKVIQNNHIVLVDKDANELFAKHNYQDIEPINDSIFKVLKQRKWAVVTTENDTIIPAKYENITVIATQRKENSLTIETSIDSIHKSPYLFLVRHHFKNGVLNFKGDTLVPIIYDEVKVNAKDSIFITLLNHQQGAINSSGVEVLKPQYSQVLWNKHQQCFVYSDVNNTYLKANHKKSITLNQGIQFSEWSGKNGLFFAQKNKKKGMLNTENTIVIPIEYQRLYDLDKNFIIGITSQGATVFNTKGKRVLSDFYNVISVFYTSNDKPLFLVKKKDLMAVVDEQNKFIIPLDNHKLTITKRMLIKAEFNEKIVGYFDFNGRKYF